LLSLFVLSGCSFSLAEDITPPPGAEVPLELPTQPPLRGPLYPLVNPDPAAGSQIYFEKCAACHGTTGLGDGEMAGQLPVPAPALGTDQVARVSTPAGWYAIVTQGNLEQRMPPFNSLTDRQRWDVIAYLYSLSNTTQRVIQGEELYQQHCAACHGESGDGNGPEAKELSAQPSDFTDQEFMANVSTEQLYEAISSGAADMPPFGEELSADELWALTAFLRSLTFTPQVAVSAFTETPAPTAASMTAEIPSQQVEATPSGYGRVDGQVISLSGGDIPENLTVTLYGFDQMQQAFTAEADVEAEGAFAFEEVEMPEGRAFLASLDYEGVAYSSDIGVVDSETKSFAFIIPYYETTTDSSVLSVDRLHLILQYLEPDIIRVVEMYIISNPGDQVVVAPEDGSPVISYKLPDGATNLQFEDGSPGDRYIELADGFGDLAVVRPGSGQHQVIYSYDLPYDNKLDFRQTVQLPVNAVVIMLPEDGLKVTGEQLQEMGTRDVQGISYRMYSGDRLEAGSDLSLNISGRPRISSPGLVAGTGSNLVIGLAAFGLALIVAGGWLYMRSRDGKDEGEISEVVYSSTAAEDEQDVDTLFDAILALDDQYQAGELPEEAYTQRRAELKERIKELLKEEDE
jgi:mono/diheme cytochrome c family protein